MAGVLSVGLIPERGEGMDEVIEVNGCAPGWILLESGDNWWCVADPSWSTPPGGGDPGEDGGGGGGGGGSSEPEQQNGWDDDLWEEMKRRWRCSMCTNNAQKCIKQAMQAENLCRNNARMMADWRCDPAARHGDTLTPWGCTLHMHDGGMCPGVPSPWGDSDNEWWWDYECEKQGGGRGALVCEGRALATCSQAWAVSHPGGSTQVIDSGTFTANFQGVGAAASKTVTATYNLTPATGFIAACAAVGNHLASGCTTEQNACYTDPKNNCEIP